MSYPKIEDLEIYNLAIDIAEKVCQIASKWERINLNTIGYQVIRSVDSIGANISEGYGRYSFKENKQFCYYARGSLFETKTWLLKALKRDIMSENEYQILYSELELLHKKLNSYIAYISKQINQKI